MAVCTLALVFMRPHPIDADRRRVFIIVMFFATGKRGRHCEE